MSIEDQSLSIKIIGEVYGVTGANLSRQYKYYLSDYTSWEHRFNATDFVIYKRNLGAQLSMAEIALSQGELYTIVTNKAAKDVGRKYIPHTFRNGDTRRQLLARSRYIVMKHFSTWTESQCIRAEILFEHYPEIKYAYEISMEMT